MSTKEKGKYNVRLPVLVTEDQAHKVNLLAERDQTSMCSIVRRALALYLTGFDGARYLS